MLYLLQHLFQSINPLAPDIDSKLQHLIVIQFDPPNCSPDISIAIPNTVHGQSFEAHPAREANFDISKHAI